MGNSGRGRLIGTQHDNDHIRGKLSSSSYKYPSVRIESQIGYADVYTTEEAVETVPERNDGDGWWKWFLAPRLPDAVESIAQRTGDKSANRWTRDNNGGKDKFEQQHGACILNDSVVDAEEFDWRHVAAQLDMLVDHGLGDGTTVPRRSKWTDYEQ